MKRTAIILVAVISAGLLVLTGCAAEPEADPTRKARVEIRDFAFRPKVVRLSKGGEVTWVNRDSVYHTATADEGAFDSRRLDQGDSYTQRFDQAGTYTYYCVPHPNMKGTIIVE